MTPEQAAWVRDHAWPTWMKALDDEWRARKFMPGVGCHLFHRSPCQGGICPPCSGKGAGGHEACRTRGRIIDPPTWFKTVEENWVLEVGGLRSTSYGDAVLLPTCRGWLCPCGCWRDLIEPSGQLTLASRDLTL